MKSQKPQPRTRKRPNPYARAAASRANHMMVVAVREQRRADVRDPERILRNFARWFMQNVAHEVRAGRVRTTVDEAGERHAIN